MVSDADQAGPLVRIEGAGVQRAQGLLHLLAVGGGGQHQVDVRVGEGEAVAVAGRRATMLTRREHSGAMRCFGVGHLRVSFIPHP